MTQGQQIGLAFSELAFRGRAESVHPFLSAILQRAPQRPTLKILDLGCGAGDLCLALAEALPDARVTGVDISSENIAFAKSLAHRRVGAEVEFLEKNYATWTADKFDVVSADSVLQWIDAEAAQLAAKFANDLSAGGLLIATVPAKCATNALLVAQRRIWRRLPRALDVFALQIARLAFPREHPEVLADRINYLRLVPRLSHGPKFIEIMREAGLELIEDIGWPGASVFKLKHRLVVFKNISD